jgi:hypothetical protein
MDKHILGNWKCCGQAEKEQQVSNFDIETILNLF